MKALQNKTVVTILAGIICVAILAISYYNRVNKKISAVPVPIAKVDLVAREQITADKIDSIKVASSAITKNVLRDTKDIEKKYVNYNTKIPKGSFFYTNAVVDWSVMPDAAWSEISDDTTIVSLPVNNRSTYGNSIYPGDKIDLYYRTQDTASQKDAVALIFNVPEDQHLLLRKALYLDGSGLIPVPRNAAYSQSDIEANISSEYLKGLINNRCKEVPLDTVANNNTTNVKVTE